jgi:uncharacterized SAM-binding protein YcdF (DUF218 family)
MSCWWVLLLIWIFFLPITYAVPLFWLEKSYFHNNHKNKKAQAIVILGSGLTNSSTMQQPNLNASRLEVVRFGAYLQRKTNLPILVTGAGSHAQYTEAEIMKQVLEDEFHAHVDFVEDKSNSTKENAQFTFEVLKENNIKSILLVSNSWHLKRASYMFEKYTDGIEIVPIADFFYASKKFYFDKEDFIFSLSTPYYQRRFYMELFRLLWLKIF